MKTVAFLVIYIGLSFYGLSQSVYSTFQTFKKSPELRNASIGMMAINLETGDTILAHNIQTSLPTASTAKLFSTASALQILGADYVPKTMFYADKTVDSSGTLNGNIWIRGGGDPTLGSKHFNATENRMDFFNGIIESIKKSGITKINGNIIVDASEFGYEGVPDNWSWSDIGNYYGAGFSGMTFFDNMIELNFKTSNSIGGKTTITSTFPNIEGLNFQNYVTSAKSSRDNAYIYGAPYSYERFVTGSIPYRRENFVVKGSNPDTEKTFGELLKKEFEKNGLEVSGTIQTGREMNLKSSDKSYEDKIKLFSIEGQKIQKIVNLTNEKSVNLFAESLVHLIGKEKHSSKIGTNANGIAVIDGYWRSRINTQGLYLNDGSGLSRSNGIAPSHFIELLAWMQKNKNASNFKESLPISGVSGTLRSVCKNQSAHGKIHAKSGTMRRIKSYAGYIDSSSGKKIAFAIIVNNHSCNSRTLVKKMEPVFNALSRY